MKHWDGLDQSAARALDLERGDESRLARELAPARGPRPKRRRHRAAPNVGSLIGLALSLGLFVGLALLLAPNSPVSPLID